MSLAHYVYPPSVHVVVPCEWQPQPGLLTPLLASPDPDSPGEG